MQVASWAKRAGTLSSRRGALSASALTLAAEAGRWDVVSQLADELEARRKSG